MRSFIRHVLSSLAVLGLLTLGAGFLGRVWPPGDSLAVFRPQLIAAGFFVMVLLYLVDGRRLALLVGTALVGCTAVTLWFDLATAQPPRSDERVYSLYQKNLLWNGSRPEEILADILQADPDFVTLQEVSLRNAVVSDGLAANYPHRLECVTEGNGGISLFSRFPIRQPVGRCALASGLILVQVDLTDGTQLWLGSVHLNWPWPYRQARQVDRIVSQLEALEGPMLIGGDFNMVPWGASVRAIAEAGGARRVGTYSSTFHMFGPFVPLAIDHILVPKGARAEVEVRPPFGSDHHGLLARIAF